MKTLAGFCIAMLAIAIMGCAGRQSPEPEPPRPVLAGTWVSQSGETDGFAVMIFESDKTGGFMAKEGPVVLGQSFTYERRNGTIVIMPDDVPTGSQLEVVANENTLVMEMPDGPSWTFRRNDDARYQRYVDQLRQELEQRREQQPE